MIGDCPKDTILHTVAYKFQSERGGVHVHPLHPPLPTGLQFPLRWSIGLGEFYLLSV